MPEAFTVIVALLAAVGVTALVWLFLGALLRSDSVNLPVIAVLRLTDKPVDVQRAVWHLNWLSQWGAADLRIILADDGMTDETKRQVELLLRDNFALTVCAPAEVPQFIRQ